jgi:hypothetical protein
VSNDRAIFRRFDYVPAPTKDNREGIRILGTWQQDTSSTCHFPSCAGPWAPSTGDVGGVGSGQAARSVLIYDGSFVLRFVRGSRTTLSNHSFGSAFDINERYDKLSRRPAIVGQKGSIRELVPIANKWGFYWGGHYETRPDGMHFEIAFIKAG